MFRVTFTKPCEVVSNVELTRQDHANRGFPGFPTPHLCIASERLPRGGLIHLGGSDAAFSIAQGLR